MNRSSTMPNLNRPNNQPLSVTFDQPPYQQTNNSNPVSKPLPPKKTNSMPTLPKSKPKKPKKKKKRVLLSGSNKVDEGDMWEQYTGEGERATQHQRQRNTNANAKPTPTPYTIVTCSLRLPDDEDEIYIDPGFSLLITKQLTTRIGKALTPKQRKSGATERTAQHLLDHWLFTRTSFFDSRSNRLNVRHHNYKQVPENLMSITPSFAAYIDGILTICQEKSGGE